MEKLNSTEIKELRERAKMTRQEMAADLGVTRMAIYLWEMGRSRPSMLACRQLRRLERRIGK